MSDNGVGRKKKVIVGDKDALILIDIIAAADL